MYFFLRGTDIHQLIAEFGRISPWSLVVSLFLTIISMVLRAWRWHVMLPDTPGSHKRNIFSHTIIGFMINNVVPARAGEAVRVMLLWRKNGYSLAVSAGSLILDRLIDIAFFFLLFAIPVIFLQQLHAHIHVLYGFAALGIFFASATLLVLFSFRPGMFKGIAGKMSCIIPAGRRKKLAFIGRDITSVLDWVRSPGKAFLVFALSAGIWASIAYNVVIFATGIPQFNFLHGAFVISFAVVGAAIPLAPGFVGTLHAAVLQALIILGCEPDTGRVIAVLAHASGYIPVTVIGFIYFLKADMSIREISRAGEIIKSDKE
jgi:uncharacterized protein (TIRG00374 family)